jgi:hypothetical protein
MLGFDCLNWGKKMKLVFDRHEVATALGKTTQEFMALQDSLEQLGFPKPVRGLDDRWSIMDVINWVNSPRHEIFQVV